MTKEEYLFKLSLMQQEAEKLQEQIKLINNQIEEFEILKASLVKIDEGKEFLANLGKGVFVKSEIKEKELFVNVGSGIVVKKKTEETCEIIDKQIKQLGEMKLSLLEEVEKINFSLQNLVEEARKEN